MAGAATRAPRTYVHARSALLLPPRAGDRLVLVARGKAGLDAALAEAAGRGADAVAEAEFGPIDVWVNNAFSGVFAPFTEVMAEEFRRVTDVTYLVYVHGAQCALRRILPRDHGTLVHVGSAIAYGRFDGRSQARSLQLWASQHRGVLATAAVASAAGVVLGWRRD